MFTSMIISIIHYTTVFRRSLKEKFIIQDSYWTIVICWLLGLSFALPSLFNWNKHTPEGIGFHCGLNWSNRSISSRVYFLLAFSLVYFTPLVVLFNSNIYTYCVIRQLIFGVIRMNESNNMNEVYERRQLTSLTRIYGSNMVRRPQKRSFIRRDNVPYWCSRLTAHET